MKHNSLPNLLTAIAIASPLHADTLLLTDNFNAPGGNYDASIFNNKLTFTQFSNLSVTLVPEPGNAQLGGFGQLTLLRRGK